MVNLVFTTPSGERREISAECRGSLMEAAKQAGIPGIDADCGGSMVCGTCHVHVGESWLARLPGPSDMEREILECVPSPHPHARLSCQIVLEPGLDGISVTVPPAQR
ncbi:MAG TPA: 2Fe-2S iron-sulfur cluster-binding protein [Solimonas sp.]